MRSKGLLSTLHGDGRRKGSDPPWRGAKGRKLWGSDVGKTVGPSVSSGRGGSGARWTPSPLNRGGGRGVRGPLLRRTVRRCRTV